MKRILSFIGALLIVYQLAYPQIGSAILYLGTGTISNVSISMVYKTVILDSHGNGIPYHIIDSLSTPDSSIAYQVQRLFPKVSILIRDKEYFVNLSSIHPSKNISMVDSTKVAFPTKKMILVKLMNGESFEGEFISSNDSTATYQSSLGFITIRKSMILSLQPIKGLFSPKTMEPSSNTKRVLVTEYNNLPLLILTIAGGAWAVSLFNDAKDYSNAADLLNRLGPKNAADEADSKYRTKLWTGFVVSLGSVIFFVLAVTPTENYIEQPITVIPTSNGIRVTVHF